MTYTALETSQQSGSPVELYDFALGIENYRFCSGEETVELNGVDYEPLEISRTTIIVSDEQGGDVISVELPSTTQLVRKYINIVPGQQGTLSIFRQHRTDTDNEFSLIFKGIVRSVGFSLNGHKSQINLQPLTGGLSRPIPRYLFSQICNHVLYDVGCSVNSVLFRYQGVISAISGNTYTIAGLSDVSRPDGWADAGFMVSPNGTDFRLILSHVGDDVELLLPFTEDVSAGQTIEAYAGCAHDVDTCSDKFNNVLNFYGFNWVPRKNIFTKGIK